MPDLLLANYSFIADGRVAEIEALTPAGEAFLARYYPGQTEINNSRQFRILAGRHGLSVEIDRPVKTCIYPKG